MSPPIAVIFGAGPGLAASIARALAPTHALLLLSRSLPGSLPKLELGNIPDDRLLALKSDGSRSTLATAFEEMGRKWPDSKVEVGVFNSGGGFNPGKFLERTEKEFRDNLESFAYVTSYAVEGNVLIDTGLDRSHLDKLSFRICSRPQRAYYHNHHPRTDRIRP
jgi:NAD(P)-dependent dehydrogenase (short-subunit alcohol dehydrogenase family)